MASVAANSTVANHLTKGPARQSCFACRRRKAKCCRTRPTCQLCTRMGEKCSYDLRPSVPKSTELAALEDRLQFVERLLSAQALFIAPFLSHILYGKLPLLDTPLAPIPIQDNRDSSEPPSSSIDVIKRMVEAGQDGNETTPAALSAFYLKLGKRLHSDNAASSTQGPLLASNISLPLSAFSIDSQKIVNVEPALPEPIGTNPPVSLKRTLQAADLFARGNRTPAVSPPAWGFLMDGEGEHPPIAQRPGSGQEPWSGEYIGRDLMASLVTENFTHIGSFLNFIHQPTFLHLIQDPVARQQQLPVLHAIVAMTLPRTKVPVEQLPQSLRSREQREALATTARKKAMLLAVNRPSLESMQALIMLAIEGLGSRSPSRGWSIIGVLCRMSIQCQINREYDSPYYINPDTPGSNASTSAGQSGSIASLSVLPMSLLHPPNDWVEAETRRRVFWSVVFLDRFASAGTGFHVALNRRDLLCKLPSPEQAYETSTEVPSRYTSPLSPFRFRPHPAVQEENDDAMEVPLSPAACLVEASEGLGSVHHFMLEAGAWGWKQRLAACQELDMKLVAWRLNLPPEVQTITLDANGRTNFIIVMVHAIFNASIILLHQNFAYPSPTNKSGQNASLAPVNPSKSCLARCITSTQEMASLIQCILPHMETMSPLLSFFIFVSGRAILVQIKHREYMVPGYGMPPPQSQGVNDVMAKDEEAFKLHIEALRSIGRRRSLGDRFADALENARNTPHTFPQSSSSSSSIPGRLGHITSGFYDLRLSAFNQGVSDPTTSTTRPIKALPRHDKHVSYVEPLPTMLSDKYQSWTTSNTRLSESGTNQFGQSQEPAFPVFSQQTSQVMSVYDMESSLPAGNSIASLPLPGLRSRSASFSGFVTNNPSSLSGLRTTNFHQPSSLVDMTALSFEAESYSAPPVAPNLIGGGFTDISSVQAGAGSPSHQPSASETTLTEGDKNLTILETPTSFINRDPALPTGLPGYDTTMTDGQENDMMFGAQFFEMPGEEYGGPVIDWSIFEKLLG